MAHELTAQDHMFSADKTPWHGLGTVTAGALTLDEALVAAHLDWSVSTRPSYFMSDEGAPIVHPGLWTIVRDDLQIPLGSCGDVYRVFQNAEGFDLLGALLEGGAIDVETAGSLRQGRYVWALARMHRDLRIDGDQHVPYILFVTGHDGKTATKVLATPVRVVCNNTLRVALAGARNAWTVRHTTNAQSRVHEARETLGLSWAYMDAFESEVERLMDQAVTDSQFAQIMEQVFPAEDRASARARNMADKQRDAVGNIYRTAPELTAIKGTGWGVVQAFSTYDLWQRPTRGHEAVAEKQALRVIAGRTEAFDTTVRQALAAVAG